MSEGARARAGALEAPVRMAGTGGPLWAHTYIRAAPAPVCAEPLLCSVRRRQGHADQVFGAGAGYDTRGSRSSRPPPHRALRAARPALNFAERAAQDSALRLLRS